MTKTIQRLMGRAVPTLLAAALAASIAVPAAILVAHEKTDKGDRDRDRWDDDRDREDTPIRHLVVIFQENVSFDHYFATYPHAANTDGSTFTPKAGTPLVNGLFPGGLLDHNPNSVQPFRLGHAEAVTCDQDHNYVNEQKSFSAGVDEQIR
jgi:phospholipase C